MSRAISAKTAQERANILIAEMKRQARRSSSTVTREMENSLEMGDGDQVLAIVKERIRAGKLDRKLVSRFLRLENPGKRKRELSIPDQHLLRIARDNWKNPAKARFLGGPTPEESREIITRLTGRDPGPPPVDERLERISREVADEMKRRSNPSKETRVRAGRKKVALKDATIGQLQIAALKAFPSSPYQKEIRAELDRRHARGERAWVPPSKKNPPLHSIRSVGSNMTEVDHGSIYILFSYETPVAIRPREGEGSKPLVTSYRHSVTTSKHIGKWLGTHGYTIKDAVRLPQEEIEAIAKRGYYTKPPREQNPRRRSAKTKKIASSYLRQRYEFFRKPSHGGIAKPAASAAHAKELADAERWAYDNDVEFKYYYGRDADEESTNEWDGRIEAVHPDGTVVDEYGYLGDDWNQAHVKAEAALALMRAMGGRRKGSRRANPVKRGGGKFVHVRKVAPGKFVKSSLRTVGHNGRAIVGHLKGETRRTKSGRTRLTVQATLRPKGGKRSVGRRRNPLIGVLGNPPVDAKYLGKVTYIEYTHGHDGKRYYHDFKPAVFAQVMDDGSVRLWHPTNNLWKLFPVEG